MTQEVFVRRTRSDIITVMRQGRPTSMQGILGNNMLSYCGNGPVMCIYGFKEMSEIGRKMFGK